MKVMRKIVEIDEELCDGCGQCVPACAEGAIEIVDGKARLVAEKYCDGLGACLGECPNGAIKVIEREAEDFDEDAVEAYLREKEKQQGSGIEIPVMECACPSTQVQTFQPLEPQTQDAGGQQNDSPRIASNLSHWPVQIKLVPPTAPFLRGANLLVLADCVAVAYPNLHADFLKDKVVMMGCPKFDDVEEYIDKFVQIFKVADIKSVTAVIMEVPCCSGLPMMVKRSMIGAGTDMPIEQVVVSTRGEILNKSVL